MNDHTPMTIIGMAYRRFSRHYEQFFFKRQLHWYLVGWVEFQVRRRICYDVTIVRTNGSSRFHQPVKTNAKNSIVVKSTNNKFTIRTTLHNNSFKSKIHGLQYGVTSDLEKYCFNFLKTHCAELSI